MDYEKSFDSSRFDKRKADLMAEVEIKLKAHECHRGNAYARAVRELN